mgnify:CR=1 FL=1
MKTLRLCLLSALAVVAGLALSSCSNKQESMKESSAAGSTPRAIIHTNYGDMTVEFWPDVAPRTVDNFLKLSRENFYNGTAFHRVIKGFMIQGGCPQGTGTGGPGYTFEDVTVGGSVPKEYVPSVDKGLQMQMEDGVLAHYPTVDFKATPSLVLSLSAMYNLFDAFIDNRQVNVSTTGRAAVAGDGLTDLVIDNGAASVALSTNHEHKFAQTRTVTPRFEFRRGAWLADGGLHYSVSTNQYVALPRVGPRASFIEMLGEMTGKGLGFTAIVDAEGRVLGIFTDGDLRRRVNELGAALLTKRVSEVMTARPSSLASDAMVRARV